MPDPKDVTLNLSDVAVLGATPGVGEERARAILAARPLHDWADLRRAGFDQDEIDRLKGQGVRLGEPPSGPVGEPGSGGSSGSGNINLGRA